MNARIAISAGIGLAMLSSGCVYVQQPRLEISTAPEQSAEQVLGTYFVLSALAPTDSTGSALAMLYPPRAQLVTYAVIGFHRDRGAWPTSADALRAYTESSPANPRLPAAVLDGFEITTHEDGSLTYSTAEDRQRGRYFKISADYRVSFPVPAGFFAAPDAAERPPATGGSTITVKWEDLPPPAVAR